MRLTLCVNNLSKTVSVQTTAGARHIVGYFRRLSEWMYVFFGLILQDNVIRGFLILTKSRKNELRMRLLYLDDLRSPGRLFVTS